MLAHAPEATHEEFFNTTNMICGAAAKEIETKRNAFLREGRLKCRAVADRLEEAGAHLFMFTLTSESKWYRRARSM